MSFDVLMFSSAAWKIIHHTCFSHCKDTKSKSGSQVFRDIFSDFFLSGSRFFKTCWRLYGNAKTMCFPVLEPWQMADGSCWKREKTNENRFNYINIIKNLLYLFFFPFE